MSLILNYYIVSNVRVFSVNKYGERERKRERVLVPIEATWRGVQTNPTNDSDAIDAAMLSSGQSTPIFGSPTKAQPIFGSPRKSPMQSPTRGMLMGDFDAKRGTWVVGWHKGGIGGGGGVELVAQRECESDEGFASIYTYTYIHTYIRMLHRNAVNRVL